MQCSKNFTKVILTALKSKPNAENGLKDAEKETNAEKRELLLKVRRILVIAHLKTLFEEAEYFWG